MLLKKLVVAAAAAIAMGSMSMAHASGTILFDPDGAGGAAPIWVDVFDWAPGNALNIGALSTLPTTLGGPINTRVVAQGALGIFQGPGGNALPVGQITFQADFFESATGVGSANANFTLGTGASSFRIYWNSSIVNNSITGLGYDAGTLIMSGSLVSLTGTFGDASIAANNACATAGTCGLLDQAGGVDNQNGTLTHVGNGSTTVEVDVSYADPNFFLSNVTSLIVDLQDTTNNAIPFNTVNPSDVVLGVTPVYSVVGANRVNGAGCISLGRDEAGNVFPVIAGGQTELGVDVAGRCDIHLLTDASTSFNPTAVPEPGTLAIAGLALGLLGLSSRRRKS